jgi:hypothetical protein
MINSSIFNRLALAFGVIFLVACDTDFNELGANIIEDDIHHNNMARIEAGVVAFDRATGSVQSNNLPLNSLGIYKNPAFGTTTAHFVTQVKLASVNPTFTSNAVIDTVYLYVPYFSTLTSTDTDGASTYSLDSIYGNTAASMKLNVYENRFFLRDIDPNEGTSTPQKYFSNDKALVDGAINPVRLNDNVNPAENDDFKISAAQVERRRTVGSTTEVIERFAPGIFLHLNKTFFQDKIVNSPSKLTSQNVFKEWLRGIYFNVQANSDDGAMATMNFAQGKIVIIYNQDKLDSNGNVTNPVVRERKTLTIDMAATSAAPINTINFFENDYNPTFTSSLASSDEDFGDDKLYVKGGEGSMAFIELNTDAFAEYIINPATEDPKILVNEANLTFFVDDVMNGARQPLRLYLYDVKNKRPIYDYYTDNTSNTANPKYNKIVHNGILQLVDHDRNPNTAPVKAYSIRLTNHINNIINKDSTNIRLGLVVTESINFTGTAALRTPVDSGLENTSIVPAASVISPVGTVLHGSNIPVGNSNYDKRLKLEIFYTKPN